MRINHNISSLRALNQMHKSNYSLDKTLERLSSGRRINHAADDAAGLAISQKMDTQVRGLGQANRNAMDGISLIQTAEGALNEVHAMLQRIRELAVQVSNGTYDASDRQQVQAEVDQLTSEIRRISTDTEFNEKKLLNGELDNRVFSNKSDLADDVSISGSVKAGDYTVKVLQEPTKTELVGKKQVMTGDGALYDADGKARIGGRITLKGESVDIEVGDTREVVKSKLRDLADKADVNIEFEEVAPVAPIALPSDKIKITEKLYGEKELDFHATTKWNERDPATGELLDLPADVSILKTLGIDDPATKGKDFKVELGDGFPKGAAVDASRSGGKYVTIRGNDGFEFKVEGGRKPTPSTGEDVVFSVLETGPLNLQIGANEGQFMKLKVPELSPRTLGIREIKLTTQMGAQDAISVSDEAINIVSSVRSRLGAYQNRLEHTTANLEAASENLTASMSRIEDADMAYEMSQFTQKNIIAQAGNSMLAQANQRPQQLLQLLQRG